MIFQCAIDNYYEKLNYLLTKLPVYFSQKTTSRPKMIY